MDTADYPSIARLATLHAQLAAQVSRAQLIVDEQLDESERLIQAAMARDWGAVSKLSMAMSTDSELRARRPIARAAKKVCDALQRDPSGRKATRLLGELLELCRPTKASLSR